MPAARSLLALALLAAAPACLAAPVSGPASGPMRFDFGSGPVAAGHVAVAPDTLYSAARGYGLLAANTVASRHTSGGDALRGDALVSSQSFLFVVSLPEGNYDITVHLGAPDAPSETTVKAETRRLVLERVAVPAGAVESRRFTVNIRNAALPGGGRVALKDTERGPGVLHWDDTLALEFNGPLAAVAGLEITPRPDALTVYLAGDSTVTDQPGEPWSAWGPMLPRFFTPGVAIANHAWSGLSLASFKAGRRLEKILSTLRPGDYVLIQFAHNDQKERGENVGAFGSYAQHLRDYADAIRERGGKPVFVTSMYRRRFEGGKLIDTLGDFPAAMRQVAAEKDVPLLDLHAMSADLFSALGQERSKLAFVHYPAGSFPGQDKDLADNTHFSPFGGYALARCIVEAIREKLPALAAHLAPEIGRFDPSRPDDPAAFSLPPSPARDTLRIPEGDGRRAD